MAPAAVADLVADAIAADRFWVFTDQFTEMALDRWQRIAEGQNPQTGLDLPGFPPAKQLAAEIRRLLGAEANYRQQCSLWLAPVTIPARDHGRAGPRGRRGRHRGRSGYLIVPSSGAGRNGRCR